MIIDFNPDNKSIIKNNTQQSSNQSTKKNGSQFKNDHNESSSKKYEKKKAKCDKINLSVKWTIKAKIYGKFRILDLQKILGGKS